MNTDPLSPEQVDLLAAYLDGGLPEAERAEAEALLARSEAAREVLAEAVAAEAHDAGTETGPDASREASPVVDLTSRRPLLGRPAFLVPLAIAASAAILFPVLRDGGPSPWTRGVRTDLPIRVPAFEATRGGTPSPDAGGVRAGAYWASYRAMVASGQAESRDEALSDIAEELRTQALRGPAEASVRGLLGSDRPSDEALDETRAELESVFGGGFLDGFVLESLRIAAESGNADLVSAILAGTEAAATLQRARALGLDQVVDVLTAAAPDPDRVAQAARTALERLGS